MVSCVGTSPLITHNGRLIDPLDPISKLIKEVSAKRTKTDADHEEMARLEFLGSLYHQPEVGPFIPAVNLHKSIVEGARLSRGGKSIERGVFFDDVLLPLVYEGPRDAEQLFAEKRFVSRMPVKVGAAKVMRTRPVFTRWRLEGAGQFDDAVLNLTDLRQAVQKAGLMIGLGDYRPSFGRYTATLVGAGQ